MKSRIRGFSSHCIFALTSSSTKYLTARRSEKIMKFAFFGRAARKSVGRLGSLSLAKVWSTLLNYFSILGETSWPSVSEGKCVVIMTPRRLRLTTLEVLAQKKVFRTSLTQLRLWHAWSFWSILGAFSQRFASGIAGEAPKLSLVAPGSPITLICCLEWWAHFPKA